VTDDHQVGRFRVLGDLVRHHAHTQHRVGAHTGRRRLLGKLLQQGGEVGKRLDFLLQEMNRETNTILSKTSGVGDSGLRITELALATKSDIEKIREQALNLE
jgi:uncharacterized protein (TIGR00255 family)